MGQIRRVFQLGQFQVCCDNHGPAAAIAAVNDEKHLLHSILGTALYSQIVNDKQVILVKAGNKLRPVLRLSLIHISSNKPERLDIMPAVRMPLIQSAMALRTV